MEDDNRISTARNRVFDTKDGPAPGKYVPGNMPTKNTSIYRSTGMNQLKDIIACGYIRPREGKVNGGHKNEVFWSVGSEKLYYFNFDSTILEVPSDKVTNGQIGALPFEDLIGIWQFNKETNRFENRIEFYKKVYEEIHKINQNKAK